MQSVRYKQATSFQQHGLTTGLIQNLKVPEDKDKANKALKGQNLQDQNQESKTSVSIYITERINQHKVAKQMPLLVFHKRG